MNRSVALVAVGVLLCAAHLRGQNSTPVVSSQLPDFTVYAGAPNRPVELVPAFRDPDLTPAVRLTTVFGSIDVALYERQKPITVANFFRYVDEGRYFMTDPTTKELASSFIHRSVSGFIIQGGGWIGTVHPTAAPAIQPTQVGALPAINNEPGISNQRGTITMAKLAGKPDSATSQWFINLRDNGGGTGGLDTVDGGFTAFGRVVGAGMEIADSINALPIHDFSTSGSAFGELPLRDYIERSSVRVANLVSLPSIARIAPVPSPLTFTATSSDGAIAEAKVSDRKLLVSGKAAGTAQITVVATDVDGATVSQTFNVNVIAAPGRLVNISTRMQVRTGEEVLIGGFIMRGDASKRVIVRAIGPSLTAEGIPSGEVLVDPQLELYDSDGNVIAVNDNWGSANKQEIIDTGVAPKSSREAAILMTLPANSTGVGYTAIVRGVNNTIGVALVEVYDLDSAPGSTILNISTRGRVGTQDDRVMIGGFFVGGTEAKRILIRALGPSLTGAGVAGALTDPKMELRDAQGALVESNNDWQTSPQRDEIDASGVAPGNSKESAILRTLSPAAYTAIVRTNTSSAGVGSVEVYQLP